jgi:hypothetical protein
VSRRPVGVRLEPATSEAEYALGVLLDLIGLEPRAASGRPDVGYGTDGARCRIPAGPQDGWDDPRPHVTRDEGLPIVHRPGGPARARSGRGPGFDLLYAGYALLTAPWERADPVDRVGCPIAADGFLARNELLETPLVHRYAALLAEALDADDAAARRTIVLTHDVDDNFAHLFGVRERWVRLRRDLRARRPAAGRRLGGLVRQLGRRGRDPNDRFDDWAAWHRGWGSRPTYFVASSGLFDPDADEADVAYDLRRPEVSATVRRAAADGTEIGLHASIRARASSERLAREREALEEVAGVPVRILRHHWWALGVPAEATLRLHPEAGIELDLSLGLNDVAGFRRGLAAPFHPFDPKTRRASAAWTIPTVAMDAALLDGRRSEDEALESLRGLLGESSGAGGALVLDWHVHSANPAALPGAAAALRRFVDDAVRHGAVLRTPLELLDERTRG